MPLVRPRRNCQCYPARVSTQNTGGSAKGGKYKKLILVLGTSKDKDINGIYRELSGLADEIIVTQADTPRACNADFIEQIIRSQKSNYKIPVTETKNVKEAKAFSYAMAKKEDLILVCGSLFVVGESRTLFKGAG